MGNQMRRPVVRRRNCQVRGIERIEGDRKGRRRDEGMVVSHRLRGVDLAEVLVRWRMEEWRDGWCIRNLSMIYCITRIDRHGTQSTDDKARSSHFRFHVEQSKINQSIDASDRANSMSISTSAPHLHLCFELYIMPIATTLPDRNITLRFPASSSSSSATNVSELEVEDESYQLLELAPEILKHVENGHSSFPYVQISRARVMSVF